MLEFLSRWLPRAAPVPEHNGGGNLLPLPVTEKGAQAKWKKHDLKVLDTSRTSNGTGISISAPIPKSSPQSLTGFDDFHGQWLYPLPDPLPESHPHPVAHSHSRSHSHSHVNLPAHTQPASEQVQSQAQGQGLSPGQSRAGPSSVAWLGSRGQTQPGPEADLSDHEGDDDDEQQQPEIPVTLPRLGPPAVIRMPSQTHLHAHAPIPIGRSVSSPSPSTSRSTTPSSKWNLRLNTSTHSLRLDPNSHLSAGVYYMSAGASSTDLFGYAYNYPLAKQLSPIAEQDYFSPESLRRSIPLPSVGSSSGNGNSTTTGTEVGIEPSPSLSYSHSYSHTNPSPSGSQTSEITRPSPSYSISHPFISRQLNRTLSQTSSRTQVSTSSAVAGPGRIPAIPKSIDPPPVIPPLNLTPAFPGPHPSQNMNTNGTGPPLRPRKSGVATMPTITASAESNPQKAEAYIDEEYGQDELQSLHADSFVTASDASDALLSDSQVLLAFPLPPTGEMDIADARFLNEENNVAGRGARTESLSSVNSGNSRTSRPSASESFISRRWNRDHELTSAGTMKVALTFRAKRQWNSCTPAFWAFWLGFVCPVLWLIGGWHFTSFGEQPPRMTFYEFYFNVAYWKQRLSGCCGRRGKGREGLGNAAVVGANGKGKGKGKATGTGTELPLPRWVTEKQSSDDGRARLQDPKRSLRGISFGYPFIPRRVKLERTESWSAKMSTRTVEMLEKPNRLFDLLYGVKLKEVRGRPESGRRMFDPWIQRCRYAFCYALIVACVGLCSASTYLIIYNTRQLR